MSAATETKIREILSEIREDFNFDTTSADADFGDAGLDSLDVASVLLEVQEAFGVKISDDAAEDINTIAKLVAYVEANKAA